MSGHSAAVAEESPEALSSRPSVPVFPAFQSLKFAPCCDTYVRISTVIPVPPPGLLCLCENQNIDLSAARGQGPAVATRILGFLSAQLQNFEISILRKELCAPARYIARNGKEKSLSTSGSRKDIIPRILAWVQRYFDDPAIPDTAMPVPGLQVSGGKAVGSTMHLPSTNGKTIRPSVSTVQAQGHVRPAISAPRAPGVTKAAPIAPAFIPSPFGTYQMYPVRHPITHGSTPIAPAPPPPFYPVSTPTQLPQSTDVNLEVMGTPSPVGPGNTPNGLRRFSRARRSLPNGTGKESTPNPSTVSQETLILSVPVGKPSRETDEKKTEKSETSSEKDSPPTAPKSRDGGTTTSERPERHARKKEKSENPAKRRKKTSGDMKDEKERTNEDNVNEGSTSETCSGRDSAGLDLVSASEAKNDGTLSKAEAVVNPEVSKSKPVEMESDTPPTEGTKGSGQKERTQVNLKREELALRQAEFTMRKEAHDVAMRAAKCMALQKAVALEDECYKLIVDAERVVANAGSDATPAMHARVKNLYVKLETVQGMAHE